MGVKTVGLPELEHQRLKRYCERHGLGLGEFIAASVAYFERHGLNPATHESPAGEMNRLIKRLDQVIAFIRKQESELLRPMVEAVSVSEARIEQRLVDPARGKQVQELGGRFDLLTQQLNKLLAAQLEQAKAARAHAEQLAQEQSRKQLAALAEISRFLDEKNKGGLMGNLTNIFK